MTKKNKNTPEISEISTTTKTDGQDPEVLTNAKYRYYTVRSKEYRRMRTECGIQSSLLSESSLLAIEEQLLFGHSRYR